MGTGWRRQARRAALPVAALAAVAAAWVRVADGGNQAGTAMKGDADFLYLPALWDDVVHHGAALSDWRVPPSPYLLPDGALFVVARLLGGVWGGIVLASAGQLLLVAAVSWCWSRCAGMPRRRAAALAVVVTAVLYGVAVVAPGPFSRLAPITNHGGVAIAGAAWLAGVVVAAVRGPTRAMVGLLVLGGALLVCSDGLFDGAFTAPALAVVVLVATLGPPDRRGWRTAALVLVPLAATVLGRLLASRLPMSVPPANGPNADAAAWVDELQLGWRYWRRFIVDAPLVALGWTALLAAVASRAVATLRRPARADVAGLLAVAAVLVVLSDVATVAAVGVLVRTDPRSTRYWLPAVLAPCFAAGALVWSEQGPRTHAALPGRRALAGVGVAALVVAVSAGPAQALAPSQLACLDDLARARGLRTGVSAYWEAKPITVHSATGLEVAAVDPHLHRRYWIEDLRWSDRPAFDFAVINTAADDPKHYLLDEDDLRANGEVVDVVTCGTWRVLVFGAPGLVLPS